LIKLKDPSLILEQAVIGSNRIDSKNKIEVLNKATLEKIGSIPYLGQEETKSAIEYANKSFSSWKKLTAKERSKFLKNWHKLILENQDDLSIIISSEQGKPFTESKAEILYAASYVEWFSEEAKRVYGDLIPSHKTGTRILVLKEPIGVVATITPWNFPAAMLTRKVAPAFAVGCTVVSKPSELTPFTALALFVLAERAGMPPGVWNMVMGDYVSIGEEFTKNQTVKKISFTGSTKIGSVLMRESAPSIKKLSLELGGNAAFLVLEDANIDEAVKGAILSKYRNAGQTCVSVNRFYVHEKVAQEFTEKLKQAVLGFKIGNGLEDGVTQGPLISEQAVLKVEEHISDAITKGAKLICGGKRHSLGKTFFEPTILFGTNEKMKFAQEETFGPVSAIQTFQTDDEAIKLANQTEHGLASYFYTNDISRIWKISESIEAGMIGINEGIISSEQIPFGGIKQSGIGREGSKYGMDDYLNLKYLCLGGLNLE
jgi:succinate-semialdehyde dehydrogenase / glutarate-semialdehyde dehydrogenase